MAIKERIKRSKEEIIDQTARLVACTLNPEKMGLTPEQVDFENFVTHFKEALTQLFETKKQIYLAIGSAINTDCSGVYSNDMHFILDGIEKIMNTKFYFYFGIAVWVCEDDIYSVWLPH